MNQNFSTSVEKILSSHKLLLNSPAHGQLGGDLYSNVHNSEIELLQRQNYTGRYKISANSLTIPGQSSFYLVPGTLINSVYVYGSIVAPQHARAGDGWLYKLIDRLEIVVSGNSSIQSLQISGEALFLATMAECKSSDKRNALLRASPAFNLTGAGATVEGCIPIRTFFSSPELRGAFPLDSSTLGSQVQVNISWKNSYDVISGSTGNAITAPVAFAACYMRANQVELSEQFISHRMAENSSLVYSIPSLYCQSFETTKVLTHGTETSVDLTSIPSGMLQSILVSAVPSSWNGLSTTLQYAHPYGIDFLNSRMLYNGQEILRYEHGVEEQCQQTLKDNGDTGWEYDVLNTVSVAAAAVNGLFKNKIHVYPFANDVKEVMSGRRHESTPNFSGSTLQLFFSPQITAPYDSDIITRTTLATPTAENYKITIVYVLNSLIEIQQKSVSMEL
jgi:hypothetical protein